MIIYDFRKPVEFQNGNCVGVTGENLAHIQEFLIKGMRDTSVDYTIHLRFSDGSVNSVVPDSTLISADGTRLVWKVKKTDVFKHGYFELQLEGHSDDGLIFQTEIVTLYADESLAIEDKEYANPNSETLRLRDEANSLVYEIKAQQKQIENNYELISDTDINTKETLSNKVNHKDDVTDEAENYPSVKFLNDNYYNIDEAYSSDEVDSALAEKADKATTLEGYGITDAYTKTETNAKLANKLSSSDGSVLFRNLNAADVIANGIAGGNTKLVRSTDVYAALSGKANTAAVNEINTALAEKANASTVNQALNTKEALSNKVNHKDDVTDESDNYPSVKFLNDNYYNIDEAYSSDEVDSALAEKADKATTLTGYGITNAYTRQEVDARLGEKLSAPDGRVHLAQLNDDVFASEIAGGNTKLVRSTAVYSALAAKYDASNVETGSGTLECADETLADKLTATFKYQKIGKYCILDVLLKSTESAGTVKEPIRFNGLPFVAKSSSYSACSSNHPEYADLRTLAIPVGGSMLRLNGTLTSSTAVSVAITYRIEN